MPFDNDTKRACPYCGKEVGGGRGNLKSHINKCKERPIEEEPEGEEVMTMFVEVNSVEKGCPVVINLEHVVEIAPLKEGGCALFFVDQTVAGGRSAFKVTDEYDQFKQFALQTVSADDIAKKIAKLKG